MSKSLTGPRARFTRAAAVVAALVAARCGPPPRPRPPRRLVGLRRERAARDARGRDVRTGDRQPRGGRVRTRDRRRRDRARRPARRADRRRPRRGDRPPARAGRRRPAGATATARVTDLRLVPLPGQIPAPPIPAGLASLSIPGATVDLTPAIAALVTPPAELLAVSSATSSATGRCAGGRPALTATSATTGLRVLGRTVAPGRSTRRSRSPARRRSRRPSSTRRRSRCPAAPRCRRRSSGRCRRRSPRCRRSRSRRRSGSSPSARARRRARPGA